jgi:alpha-galactosidase
MDTEGLALAPGESWELEEFTFMSDTNRAALLATTGRSDRPEPSAARFKAPPAGWCSWYCFGPRVTGKNVMDNLASIVKDAPQLKYVQLDDGYQPAMGDWLETGKAFGGDVQGVLQAIRKQGFEPAILGGPVHCRGRSHVFQQHPNWFMQGEDGRPLPADKVTFQGWRRGPWYALDGTNPEVQKHLENVFRTMRNEWGVTYFKLDANFWGAMHGGKLHDPKATRIEAYRRHAGSLARGGRQLHPGVQSSHLGVIRPDSRVTQFGGYQSQVGYLPESSAAESAAQLAERQALVERSRCCHTERRHADGRVPLPCQRDHGVGRPGAFRRRPVHAACRPS